MTAAADLGILDGARRTSIVQRRLAAHLRLPADLLAAAVAATAVGLPLLALALLTLLWPLAIRLAGPASGPAGLGTARAATVPVARAVLGLAVVCWTATLLVPMPERLALAMLLAGTASAAVRVATTARAAAVRALLVTGTGEGDLHELSRVSAGALLTVGICAPDEMPHAVSVLNPDVVVAVPDAQLAGRAVQRLAWHLETPRVPLLVHTRLTDVEPGRAPLLRTGSAGLLHVRPATRSGAATLVADALWRALSALALVLLAPIMLGIAVAVRSDSPGPAVFRQIRVGRDGRTFTMLKFRTMHADADRARAHLRSDGEGVLFKLRADPRVTRVGRVLRKYSLDELPQLFNIVAGQMALVGPRPALPEEVAKYDEDSRRRLVMKPGLTGLWQVSGRSDLSWQESVRLDLDYVDNWSFARDTVIIARTVAVVVRHRGAY